MRDGLDSIDIVFEQLPELEAALKDMLEGGASLAMICCSSIIDSCRNCISCWHRNNACFCSSNAASCSCFTRCISRRIASIAAPCSSVHGDRSLIGMIELRQVREGEEYSYLPACRARGKPGFQYLYCGDWLEGGSEDGGILDKR